VVSLIEHQLMTIDQNDSQSPFVLIPETVKMTGCPPSTLIKYSTLGKFPPMIRLLGNRIAFIRADVQNWVDSRVASAIGAANDE
jgi:predicted DNA-binding transcriptional regulator AlpA